MIELQGKFGKDCKIFANTIENEAIGTIQNILNNPVTTGVPEIGRASCRERVFRAV